MPTMQPTTIERLNSFEGFIHAMAKRLTSDVELRNDLAQEMRIRLWKALLESTSHTDSYLRQACVRSARDYIKSGRSVDSRKRRSTVVTYDDQAPVADDRAAIETIEFVQRLRDDLIGRARDVADLLGRGRAPVQIAAGFGVSRQAIGHRIAEIRQLAYEMDESLTPCRAAS